MNPVPLPLHCQGILHTVGYAHVENAARLIQLMQEDQHVLLLDIRFRPQSRWFPRWNQKALQALYGEDHYCWDQRLGNVHYRNPERGIQLAEGYEEGVREAVNLLWQGRHLVLLCACKDAQTCHRTLVAWFIQGVMQAENMPAWSQR